MKYRRLGKTDFPISEISLGTWQVGGKWGSPFNNKAAENILNTAIDQGVNFIDTADVYSDGLSEEVVGRVVRSRSEKVYVATKCSRKIIPHVAEAFTPQILTAFVEDSLKRTGLETLDLVQLHCPPTQVLYRPEIFETYEQLRQQGKIRHLGVSVQKVEEGIKAMQYPNVASVQIIFNLFRQRPSELFFELAKKNDIGIIARVPLASGLLTGKFNRNSTFNREDHRSFNRNGEVFDKGETFSGIDFDTGLAAVEELKQVFPEEENLAPRALQWILQFKEISCIIPGASKVDHLISNLSIYHKKPLTEEQINSMNNIYNRHIKSTVHQRW